MQVYAPPPGVNLAIGALPLLAAALPSQKGDWPQAVLGARARERRGVAAPRERPSRGLRGRSPGLFEQYRSGEAG